MLYQENDEVVYTDPETGNQTKGTVIGRSEGFPEYYVLKFNQENWPLVRYITAQPKEIKKFEIKGN